MTEPVERRPLHEVVHDDRTLDMLRSAFKRLNRSMIHLWRLGLGRWSEVWPAGMGRILVLEHHGRKSGTRYLTPLNFSRGDRVAHCVAAFGTKTDWYRNALAGESVVLYLSDGAWGATVSDVSDQPDRLALIRSVLLDAGFASYLAGIDPRSIDDSELGDVSARYRVVRFDLMEPVDRRIDDLRWVWALAVPSLAAIVVLRARRARRVHGE